jgi:hypothetical protein
MIGQRQFYTVWTLRRGVLAPPEPLSARDNLLANVSYLCHELEKQKTLLREFERLYMKKPPASVKRERVA